VHVPAAGSFPDLIQYGTVTQVDTIECTYRYDRTADIRGKSGITPASFLMLHEAP
jgi:hypothetical protein